MGKIYTTKRASTKSSVLKSCFRCLKFGHIVKNCTTVHAKDCAERPHSLFYQHINDNYCTHITANSTGPGRRQILRRNDATIVKPKPSPGAQDLLSETVQ